MVAGSVADSQDVGAHRVIRVVLVEQKADPDAGIRIEEDDETKFIPRW